MRRRTPRVGLAVAALAASLLVAVAPVEPALVERYYSQGAYAVLQRGLTALSNHVPIALLDVFGVVLVGWWVAALVRHVRELTPFVWRTVTVIALLYLAFIAVWGLNYRRVPLVQKIAFDPAAVTPEGAQALADTAVGTLNALHQPAHAAVDGELADLADAFARAQAHLGVSRPARPARPKVSLLDPYFRAAGVDGMTDPFLLETLVVSTLLPVERPFVIAHEWSHLAGFADEGDANFVGWLTCMLGGPTARYSGWLFLYREVAARLTGDDRADLADALGPGPRADLGAIAERQQRDVRPALARAGWRAYDRYLKANRVESGAASYAEVVRLVLGASFGPDWRPLMQ